MIGATIQALDGWDDEGGTCYVLSRPGVPPVVAPWPHPLLELAPGARWLPANTGGVTRRQGFVTMRQTAAPLAAESLVDDLLRGCRAALVGDDTR